MVAVPVPRTSPLGVQTAIVNSPVVNLLTVFLHTVFEVIVFTKKCRDIQECFDDGRDEGVHGLKRAIGIEPECSDKGFENIAEFFEILAPVFGFHIFDVSRNDKESIEV